MVTEVRPEIEPDTVEVAMGVLGRSLDAISRFVTSLETSGAFLGVLNRQVELTEDGMYRAVLRGRYLESASRPTPSSRPPSRHPSAPPSRRPSASSSRRRQPATPSSRCPADVPESAPPDVDPAGNPGEGARPAETGAAPPSAPGPAGRN